MIHKECYYCGKIGHKHPAEMQKIYLDARVADGYATYKYWVHIGCTKKNREKRMNKLMSLTLKKGEIEREINRI